MISVTEAKEIVQSKSTLQAARSIALDNAAGLVLAEDIYSTIDIPAYPQSSMDGYAFRYQDKHLPLHIISSIAAGEGKQLFINANQSARIFTGAAVPEGADTVVMQEKVVREGDILSIKDDLLKEGGNVRPQGSEIKANELALPANTILTPPSIGFLAGIGLDKVLAYPPPRINIIITGNELVKPGETLSYGQVFESNAASLVAALKALPIKDISVVYVTDDEEKLTKQINECLTNCDLLLLTGGVSVGEYDFVAASLASCGVEEHFHKIKQKPGKPILFGSKGDILVFGLPGNPASVLTCFYEYVFPSIEKRIGYKKSKILSIKAPLTLGYNKNAGLTHFLKGFYDGEKVETLIGQESYKMKSYAIANCLIVLEEEKEVFEKGELVEVHILPF